MENQGTLRREAVVFQDGSSLAIPTNGITLGRGVPRCWIDPAISRQQINITPVAGVEGVLKLTNIGMNPVLVEIQQEGGSKGSSSPGAGPTWQLTEMLDKGMDTLVDGRCRFYLVSKQQETLAVVSSAPASSPSPCPADDFSLCPAPTPLTAAAAAAAAAASVADCDEDIARPSKRPCLEGPSRHGADVDAAAAAAAAAAGGGHDVSASLPADAKTTSAAVHHDVSTTHPADVRNASAAAPPGKHGHASSQFEASTSTHQSHPLTDALLVQRQSTHAAATTSDRLDQPGTSGSAAATGSTHRQTDGTAATSTKGCHDGALFHLLSVRALKASGSCEGPLGMRMKDVVSGMIRLAVVSNYMVDMVWLLSACPALWAADKVVVVHGEKGEREKDIEQVAANAGLKSFTCHRPPLPIAYGTHHSKAFLLTYDSGLRLIIHTANLIYPDCNNKTQGLWYQDFPRKDASAPPTSEMERDLLQYLGALALPRSIWREVEAAVKEHDFSSATAKLVGSVPGYHHGAAVHRNGHMRVRALLSQEPMASEWRQAPVVVQCSSMGSLDEAWLLGEFGASLAAGSFQAAAATAAAYANDPTAVGVSVPDSDATGSAGTATQARSGTSASASASSFFKPGSGRGMKKSNMGGLSPSQLRIVWPTVEEVRGSVEGWAAGYSIPGNQKNVGKPFLQRYWHRYGGEPVGRARAMPHIKTYTRHHRHQLAWYLLTSHNLSKAAWGSLQKGGSQLMVRSYELGVLFLPSLTASASAHRHTHFSCTPEIPPHTHATPSVTPPISSAAKPHCAFVAWGYQHAADATGNLDSNATLLLPPPGSSGQPTSGACNTCHIVRVPAPYRFPPVPYSSKDKPWMCDVEYPGLDSLGRPWGVPARFYNLTEADGDG